jgi:hypothetical protein
VNGHLDESVVDQVESGHLAVDPYEGIFRISHPSSLPPGLARVVGPLTRRMSNNLSACAGSVEPTARPGDGHGC